VKLNIAEVADAAAAQEEEEEREETKNDETASTEAPESEDPTLTTTTTTTTPAAPPISSFDFSKYPSPQDLESLGADALKTELQKRGLLCGGTIAERAARLYMLKDTRLEKLDRKHFALDAKKVKNAKRKRSKANK